ncbi:MAG: cytochrome [Mycobacterium sp.]|jgi:cytochrome P450|nr:cytochrome [Mycobacterium sp.]
MTTIADRWGTHPEHFWLCGRRPEQPVQYDEKLGMWNVYGYPEALAVLGDPRIFSSDVGRVYPCNIDESFNEGDLSQMDPPKHRKLRTLVSHAFTPKIVADLEPRISGLTHELLDAMAGKDQVELIADFAFPLPMIVIAELLGVPAGDRQLFRQWMDKMLEGTYAIAPIDDEEGQVRELDKQLEQLREMTEYWHEHAAERRRRPRQDLLSHLVHAEVDGTRLTEIQVVNIANLMLVAGHHTTTMLLGNTVLCLDACPDQAARVRDDRSMVPTLIEESLRFLSPVAGIMRATTTEVDLAGQRVPRDQALMVWCGAANRDERRFPRPDAFDAARDPNPHLGFGRGNHFCLGASLARLEGRIALNVLLDRYPVLRTDPDNPPVFMQVIDATGPATLPLRTR